MRVLSVRCGGARPQADALIELSPPFNGTAHPSASPLDATHTLNKFLAVFDVLVRRHYIEEELGRPRRRHQR